MERDDLKANLNRRKLDMMYDNMWVHRTPMTDFVHKYFKTTDDPMASLKNIAYTNMRCLNVSNYIRKQQGKTEKYLVGETFICRVYKKLTSNDKFNVNYRLKIVRISGTFRDFRECENENSSTTRMCKLWTNTSGTTTAPRAIRHRRLL